jgi:hypothetical protein
MRVSRVVGLGALAALVVVSIASAHVHSPQGIGGDSYRNPTSQHATNVEPDSFSFGNTVVTTYQTGRFFNGGGSNIAWATSTDGGRTWRKGNLPSTTVFSTPPGPWARISDPAVAYDPEHNVWMISTLGLDASPSGRAVLTSRSTDGGLTWGPPVTVAETFQGFYDKNWIACDTWSQSPHYGNCYTEWDDNSAGNQVLMSTSTDGGLTWGAPQAPPVPSGLGGQPVVQPNGTVVVPYTANYGAIRAFRSTNGGASWTTADLISVQQQRNVGGSLRDPPLPSAEVDSAGRVYVAWHGSQFRPVAGNDILFSTSTDGVNWTPPARIPIHPANGTDDHFLPGIGVDPVGSPGRVGVVYYYHPVANCSTATCQLHAAFVSSGDGGATWHPPITLAGPMLTTWAPNTSQGYMVGDYFSTSFVNDEAHPVFAAGTGPRPPNSQFNMLTWEAGLTIPAGRGPLKAARVSAKPVYEPMWLVRERATAPPPTAN